MVKTISAVLYVQVQKKVLKKNNGLWNAEKGLKQVADIKHSSLLHPYFKVHNEFIDLIIVSTQKS